MSKLGNDLYRQLGGAVSSGLQGQMNELRQRFGVTAAAKVAGVDRRTWQRIAAGKTHSPTPATRGRIETAVRESRARAAIEEAQRQAAGLAVSYKYAGRVRDLRFSESGPGSAAMRLKSGTTDRMVEAYANSDREGVARAFVDGVDDDWYHDMFAEAYYEDTAADGDDSSASGAFV